MKTVIKILIYLWMAFWLYAGFTLFIETPLQIKRDQDFMENQIKPSVNFVKDFKTSKGRLPSNREYYTWQREFHKDYSSDLTQEIDSLIPGFGTINYIRSLQSVDVNDRNKFKNANWNTDFAIGVWRGEWTTYYFSWSNSYDLNKSSWLRSFLRFLATIGLTIFPFVVVSRKKNTE